jgi:hypothetical protein
LCRHKFAAGINDLVANQPPALTTYSTMTNNISMSAHDDKNFVSKNPSFSFNSKPMDVEETIVCLKKIVFAIGVVDTDDAP